MKYSIYSLKWKSLIVIVLSVLVGVASYFAFHQILVKVVDNYYLSEERCEERAINVTNSFKEYVKNNNISTTDINEITKWCESNKYIYFMLFEDDTLKLVIDGDNVTEYKNGEITNTSDYTLRPVDFSDGTFNIAIMEYSESFYYTLATFASVFLAVLLSFILLLFYLTKLVKRISVLSKKVNNIHSTSEKLIPDRYDELGEVYSSVENMKEKLVYHYEKEIESYSANKELITNMSHDIRTPLTSIIGYNEMMIHQGESVEEMKQYAQFSLDKANQLKEMSDKLFKYFLVYNNDQIEVNKEYVEASVLIQQMLGEQLQVIKQQGFDYSFDCDNEEFELYTDPLLVKRILDNIFSNIKKYADKKVPIKINMSIIDSRVKLTIANTINKNKIETESTHIGLKSCKKIMQALEGNIEFSSNDDIYTTTILL